MYEPMAKNQVISGDWALRVPNKVEKVEKTDAAKGTIEIEFDIPEDKILECAFAHLRIVAQRSRNDYSSQKELAKAIAGKVTKFTASELLARSERGPRDPVKAGKSAVNKMDREQYVQFLLDEGIDVDLAIAAANKRFGKL